MSDTPTRVAVTGAAGYVGTRLIHRLEGERRVEHILAIDVRPPSVPYGPGVVYLQHDVATSFDHPFLEHRIDTVVHLAYALRPSRRKAAIRRVNVGGTDNLLRASAADGVRKIVYLSSTSVYGAHPDNPPMLTEASPPRPVQGFQYSEDKAQAESLVRQYAQRTPELRATILRCCPVVGPSADNFISRAFLKPFLVAVRGYDPPMQLIHEDDLADVLALCVLDEVSGVYNLAGEGVVHWSEMARMLGRKLVALPAPFLYWVMEAAWRLGLQSDSPSSGLDFIRYRWTASTDKIQRELGVTFRYSSRDAWEAFARQHREPSPAYRGRD
jgi:UDP-glucose 4-epimerase